MKEQATTCYDHPWDKKKETVKACVLQIVYGKLKAWRALGAGWRPISFQNPKLLSLSLVLSISAKHHENVFQNMEWMWRYASGCWQWQLFHWWFNPHLTAFQTPRSWINNTEWQPHSPMKTAHCRFCCVKSLKSNVCIQPLIKESKSTCALLYLVG